MLRVNGLLCKWSFAHLHTNATPDAVAAERDDGASFCKFAPSRVRNGLSALVRVFWRRAGCLWCRLQDIYVVPRTQDLECYNHRALHFYERIIQHGNSTSEWERGYRPGADTGETKPVGRLGSLGNRCGGTSSLENGQGDAQGGFCHYHGAAAHPLRVAYPNAISEGNSVVDGRDQTARNEILAIIGELESLTNDN